MRTFSSALISSKESHGVTCLNVNLIRSLTRSYQRGVSHLVSGTYLLQELGAHLRVSRPHPLPTVRHVEETGVHAGLGVPELASLYEVVV